MDYSALLELTRASDRESRLRHCEERNVVAILLSQQKLKVS